MHEAISAACVAVGWHGDDGHKFHRSGRGAAYGPAFGPGDVVGCGLDFSGTIHYILRLLCDTSVLFALCCLTRDLKFRGGECMIFDKGVNSVYQKTGAATSMERRRRDPDKAISLE